MNIVLFIAGFLFLFIGGELLVKGSVAIARKLGLSSLLIGLTVVAFGTSSPELIVSMIAAINGKTDIAIGNIVGSNIANVLLILGFASIIDPIRCEKPEISRDSFVGVLAGVILAVLSIYQMIPRSVGFILVAILIVYIVYCYLAERADAVQEEDNKQDDLVWPVLFCLFSLVFLYFGAQWLITAAVGIATRLEVPDSVIGLTLVAVGTSLPELATSIVAAIRKHSDIAIGNILGSNLFNILGILGLTAMVSPLRFEGRIAEMDVWIMLAVAVLLLILIRVFLRIGRTVGVLFLLTYIAYTVWAYVGA